MKSTVVVAPSNSVVLVMDRSVGTIPAAMAGRLVAATESCLAIGTLSEYDGLTSISLSDEEPPSSIDDWQQFDKILATPARQISVCSVLGEVFLELHVTSDRTHVQVWTNDVSEPDGIAVVINP